MIPSDTSAARTGADLPALASAAADVREVAEALDAEGRRLQRLLDELARAAGLSRPRAACDEASRELPALLLASARVAGTLADGADAQHRLLARADR